MVAGTALQGTTDEWSRLVTILGPPWIIALLLGGWIFPGTDEADGAHEKAAILVPVVALGFGLLVAAMAGGGLTAPIIWGVLPQGALRRRRAPARACLPRQRSAARLVARHRRALPHLPVLGDPLPTDPLRGVAWMGRVGRAAFTDATRARLRIAHTDPLTGLRNRPGFLQGAQRALVTAKAEDRPYGLLAFDLDGFKRLNDEQGHAAGDDLLCQVADLTRALFPGAHSIARLGGDEFILALPLESPEHATEVAETLEDALAPLVGASVGWSLLLDDGFDLEPLMQAADRRSYRAKLQRPRSRPIPWSATPPIRWPPHDCPVRAPASRSPLPDPPVRAAAGRSGRRDRTPLGTEPPASAVAPFVVIAALAVAFVIGQLMRGALRPAELVGAFLVVLTSAVAIGVVITGERSGTRRRRPNLRLYAAGAIICTLVIAASATFSRGLASPYLAALPLGAGYLGLVLPRRTSAWIVAVMTLALVPLAIFGPPVTWLQALCVFVLVPGARFFGVLGGAAHRHAERVARQLTRADRLTRTLSRSGFLEELAHALVALRRARTPVAMFLIDLDGLKEINGARGSAGGDELLAWCGQRLAEILPRGSSAGRLGGDEFGVAAAGMTRAEADRFAIELRNAFDERHQVSIGVATSEDSTVTVSDLLRVGNAALRRAKDDGDRRIHSLVAGGVRPDADAVQPEPPVLTYEQLRRNGGRPRKPSPTVLIGKFMSGGLIGLGAIGIVLCALILVTDATPPSLWTSVIEYGWVPWVIACFLLAIAARFIDPMNMRQVNVLIVAATALVGGGIGTIALAQGGGVLEPIMAGLALRVLFDTSVAYRPQAALTLAGTLVFLLAVVVLGPASSLRAAPYHLVLLAAAYALGQIAQQGSSRPRSSGWPSPAPMC